jgi:mRNA interferase MazF
VLDLRVKKGDLYFADLSPVVGSEQGGVRPVLVVQNDVGNKYSPTIIVAAVTSQTGKAKLPTHVELAATQGGLSKNSVVLLEQLRTIDKRRLKEHIGTLSVNQLPDVDAALGVSLGISGLPTSH